ncbi:uncharacterized protein LOC110729350 [Chenopodium quinoa]|uniref:uncharacterized protein LOC110729350 n=1 Tax=Chenopodium quinoa TaxID=63459 RepID=UPI000B77BC29|nr:uncharacterized protein LOC110729350 [Chenopodium quinoa]
MWQNTKLHMIHSRLLTIMHEMSAYGWTSSFPTDQLWISITPTTRYISLLRAAAVLLLHCCSAPVLLLCYFIIFFLTLAISVWALESSEAPLALVVGSSGTLEQEEASEGHFTKNC